MLPLHKKATAKVDLVTQVAKMQVEIIVPYNTLKIGTVHTLLFAPPANVFNYCVKHSDTGCPVYIPKRNCKLLGE